jgi:hypothetical protein
MVALVGSWRDDRVTDSQLDKIEAALGIRLPADYRRLSRAFPFKPIGRDWVYWFFNDPDRVIGSTLYPLQDGRYAGPDLLPRYVAIGQSAGGDPYLLDTASAESPVLCLSHETHAIEPAWATFAAFTEEWLAVQDRIDEAAVDRGRIHRGVVIAGLIIIAALALPMGGVFLLWLLGSG